MLGKTKYILLSVLTLALVMVGLTLTQSETAYADYTVTAGQKCQDNSEPAKTLSNGTQTYTCADSTKTSAGTAQVAGGSGQGANSNTDETTCAIEKMGWILCPIIETSGKVSDQAFQYLSKTFLETEPELVSNSNAGTKQAWELARNLANIMFIIAFLVIIYSQVTGAGITNYGIKKMLPRLIVAAIAVNASYYICQILVDLTNIMGYEIQKFLVDTARSITSNAVMPIATDGPSLSQDSGTLSQIAIGVLAVGAIVYFLLPVLGSVVLFVLITCLSIIIILLLRKTFIVLLIVAAPVAFVLYLLPNTEKYFQKWLSMFWKLLLVFPVVGILMGGGQLASSIILVAGTQSTNYKDTGEKCITLPQYSGSTQSQANAWSWLGGDQQSNQATVTGGAAIGTCTAGSVPFMLGLTAAGIAVLPLLAVWSVLKGALAATGAIGGKLGATINGMNSGAKGRLSKARQENSEYRKNRRDARAMQGGFAGNALNVATLGGARRGAKRRALQRSAKEQLARTESEFVNNRMLDDDDNLTRFGRKMAGGPLYGTDESRERTQQAALAAQDKLLAEQTDAASKRARNQSEDELRATIDQAGEQHVNDPTVAAAIKELAQRQDFEGLERALDKFGNARGSLAARTLGAGLEQTGMFTGGQLGDIARGDMGEDASYRSMVIGNAESGHFSPEKMATMGPAALGHVTDLAQTSNEAMASLTRSAHAIRTDPILNNKIGRTAQQIDYLSQNRGRY